MAAGTNNFVAMRSISNIFVLVLLGWACTQEPYGAANWVPEPGDPNNPTPVCDPDTVYFEQSILPLIQSNCAQSGCHDQATAAEGVVLVNYGTIMSTGKIKPWDPNDSELMEVITDTDPDKRMPPPPASALSAEQQNLISTWIAQGALNNSCVGDCDTNSVGFAAQVQPLINNYCKSCHSGASANAGVRLENYNDVQSVANSGRLLGVLKGQGYALMPPAGALSACNLRIVEKWIEDGALNN